eukprot:PITA_11118
MVEKYDSIVQNNVWDVVSRLKDKLVVSSHWLYKVNQDAYGSVDKHKAIFVARGFSQMGWSIHQMDVKTASLNGMIKEEVYIEQLEGDEKLIKSCKEDLLREFEMKDMGLMHYFLGIEVWQGDGELFFSQGNYSNEILKRFCMERSKPMETPLADMCYEVNQLSQVMVRPIKMYWKAAKHVLRYLRGTIQFWLWYRRTEGVKLQGFTDADWAGSPSDRKSTSGGTFSIGSAAVPWYSRK